MDQVIIDLTDIARSEQVIPGCRVELLSRDPGAPNSLLALSASAGLKPHALLARLHTRIARVHHGDLPEITVPLSGKRTAAG
jgi:alanine racemase